MCINLMSEMEINETITLNSKRSIKIEENIHINEPIANLKCEKCGKQFKRKGNYEKHKKSDCLKTKYKCSVCEKELRNSGSLHNHMLQHKEGPTFMCRFCGKLCITLGHLQIHERVHTKEKAYICEVCGKGFSFRQSLITHNSTHTGIKPFSCEHCKKAFSCVGNLIQHRRTHKQTCGMLPLITHSVQHPLTKAKLKMNTPTAKIKENQRINKKLLKVMSIEEETADNRQLLDDFSKTKRISAEIEENFDNCKFELETQIDVKNHMKYKCSFCIIHFAKKEEQDEHQIQFHSDALTCLKCDKQFASVSSLKTHEKNYHRGYKRKVYTYICDKCGKEFKQKNTLLLHREANCATSEVYACEICNKKFAYKSVRNSHRRMHDGDNKQVCRFCGKMFNWKGQLIVHERMHTGEKPYTCLYCPKSFAYRESLITHSSLHTGIKPHVCKACGNRFSCSGNLAQHKVTHASSCGVWYNEAIKHN